MSERDEDWKSISPAKRGPWCEQIGPEWEICTRAKGHAGPHVAHHMIGTPYRMWNDNFSKRRKGVKLDQDGKCQKE